MHVARADLARRPAGLAQLLGMRWWLGLAFAAVAGLTAVAVVAVLSNRSERAFRTYAQEFAVGNTVAATEALKQRRLGRRSCAREDGGARRAPPPRALRLRQRTAGR